MKELPALAGLALHPGMVLPLALKWTLPATELVAAWIVLVLLKIRLVPVVKVRVALDTPVVMVMVVLVVVMEL